MDTSEHVPIGQVLVSPGDACPRDELGRPRSLFHTGDVLRVACPFAEAEVTEVNPNHVALRWPWGQVDPHSSYLWNGEVAFEFGTDSWWPFQTSPGLERLRPGDRCLLGIPARVVHVFAVRCWWPDQDTGRLPRRPLALYVFRHGTPHDLGQPEHEVDPYQGAPVRVELLYRPYPFLADLDQVADRQGRRWEFCGPAWWVQLDRDDARQGLPPPLAAPTWPLRLLADRAGASPDPARVQQVAAATAGGSHTAHLAGWGRLVGASPVAAEHQGTPIDLEESSLDEEPAGAGERARVRASLRGLTFSQILRSYVHGWERLRQVISNEADLTIGPIQHRILVGLAETSSILRHLRTSGVTAYRG